MRMRCSKLEIGLLARYRAGRIAQQHIPEDGELGFVAFHMVLSRRAWCHESFGCPLKPAPQRQDIFSLLVRRCTGICSD